MSSPAPGTGTAAVPLVLARQRAAAITRLAYRLTLDIPASSAAAVTGQVDLKFSLAPGGTWPEIDFDPCASDADSRRCVLSVELDGTRASFVLEQGRIRVESDKPAAGEHRIVCRFVAGEAALHRRDDLIYTLFVPAHAHKTFPCFDQPDLKAPVELELRVPSGWTAIANGRAIGHSEDSRGQGIRFAPTEPLPTYLMAFVAGRLAISSHRAGDRDLKIAVPERDTTDLARNLTEILELHTVALQELQQYTDIACPYAELGIAIIPEFQFGGMEHPGATCYRRDLMLLDDSAGLDDRLRRANLIAHEMAHMWFGNLVTIPWFDDVWVKEVFANLMADKIVATAFPELDPAPAFVLRHWPPALALDRSEGARPIRQSLASLGEAAELYDATIYHKAPIALAELERTIGEAPLRDGLRRFLDDFRHANAGWPEVCERLEAVAGVDLGEFNRRWIDAAGRPEIDAVFDPESPPRYGRMTMDTGARERALDALARGSELARTLSWLALLEDMLAGGIAPARLLTSAFDVIAADYSPTLTSRVLEDVAEIFWRFLSPLQRGFAAVPLERALGRHCWRVPAPGETAGSDGVGDARLRWLRSLCGLATSEAMLARLEQIRLGADAALSRLPESITTRAAITLALHRESSADRIVQEQLASMTDDAARARFEFLAPALSADAGERDRFFAELVAGAGYGHYAVAAMRLLNRAGRCERSLHFLEPGLGFAAEIRQQGDIFLPRQWLTALFHGHGSAKAAQLIRSFIAAHELPPRFRQLVLQTADPVFRAARLRG